jgi:GNAT superfamily N-acetyltransferase
MNAASLQQAGAIPAPLRLVLDPTQYTADVQSGSLEHLLQLIGELGISGQEFLNSLRPLDLDEVAAALQYLRFAVLLRDGTAEQLAFHLRLLVSLPSDSYEGWKNMAEQLTENGPFSADVLEFITSNEVPNLLYGRILRALGLTKVSKYPAHSNVKQFILTELLLLEAVNSLAASDPNIQILFEAVNRYGNLHDYYKQCDVSKRVLDKLTQAGFKIEHLFAGGSEIHAGDQVANAERRDWAQPLLSIVSRLLGNQETKPEFDLGLDRFKFLNQLRPLLDGVQRKDRNSARNLIDQLLPKVEARQEALRGTPSRLDLTKASELILGLRSVSKELDKAPEARRQTFRLTAVRSPKLIPELFFDDTRLGSWLFKPDGFFHGEICRLLLDPATPLFEVYLEPHPRFLGFAALFPGFNARRGKTIFIDGFEYDEDLLGFRDLPGTMDFVLNSLVLDAHQAGADYLAVFNGASDRGAHLPQHIKTLQAQLNSITYHESYTFEAVDALASGLEQSLTGQFHYTEAFGYGVPLSGVIDFPVNNVTYVSIEKDTSDPRGVFEIDLRAFLTERRLMDAVTEKKKSSLPVYGSSSTGSSESSELRRRETAVLAEATESMSRMVPAIVVERHSETNPLLTANLISLHASAFPEYPPFAESDYARRMTQTNSEAYLLRIGSQSVGFALWYTTPLLPQNAIYWDEFAIDPAFQGKGLGTQTVRMLARIAGIRGYRELYLLTRMDAGAPRLARFYGREHFQFIGQYPGLGNLMRRTLSLTGPENQQEIDKLLNDLKHELKPVLPKSDMDFRSSLDPGLIAEMQQLELAFPEDIRYSGASFAERSAYPDLYVLTLRNGGGPVAFCLCYHDPTLPESAIFADSLAIKPEYQKRGIGSAFIRTVLAIPRLTHYTSVVFYCRRFSESGLDLPEYYTRRFGAEVMDTTTDRIRMQIPLTSPHGSASPLSDDNNPQPSDTASHWAARSQPLTYPIDTAVFGL